MNNNNNNNNNNVKCPICNQFVTISGINAHLDSNCQYNIVQPDGTIKDLVEDRVGTLTMDTNKDFNSNSNSGQHHIHFNSSSISKKKVQPTLFNQLSPSGRKRNVEDNNNTSIYNFSPKNKKMTNFKSSTIHDSTENFNNNNNGYYYNYHSDKKFKLEDMEKKMNASSKFDINKKYDNSSINNNNKTINPMKRESKKQLPLAELVRPTCLEDYFGQEDLMGEESILKTLIQENKVPSIIFWGPPGVGKTCLARIIAHHNNSFFREISGTIHSLNDMKKASEECANYLKLTGRKAILIIDEIHRFNKLQQDSLLPWVERGSFILIGATTENPSFKLNSALLSRCRVFQLKKLSQQAVVSIIQRAARIKLELYDKNLIVKNNSESKTESESELKLESKLVSKSKLELKSELESYSKNNITAETSTTNMNTNDINNIKKTSTTETTNITDSSVTNDHDNNIYVDKDVLELLAVMSDGDARNALNIVDMTLNSILSSDSKNEITRDMIKMSFQKTQLLYDKDGEEHNNLISAFHESIRGSDADATLYWLGRMIYAGEDPLYIARRLIRVASEDIGFGDNYALTLAVSCYQACQFIGMPECDVVLAHTSVYMARAKKSVEVFKALSMVKEVMQNEINYSVPLHLRNAPTQLMKDLGYGEGLLYVPDYEEPVEQEYLPKELKCRRYLGVFEENRRKAYEEKKRLEQEQEQNREKGKKLNNDKIDNDNTTIPLNNSINDD